VTNTNLQPSCAWGNEGVGAHCRRVATWARELAGALGLSAEEAVLVEQAALHHHLAPVILDGDAQRRLLTDLGVEAIAGPTLISEGTTNLLQAFWRRRKIADAAEARLVAALEICDDFDQFFEAEPLSDSSDCSEFSNSPVETMMSFLQLSSRADVNRVVDRLPVFPRAGREIVKHATNPEVTLGELVQVASLDPVLAGLILQTANSSYYSRATPVSGIQQAIAYIGLEATRKALLGATLRPIYGSPRLHSIWNHSLDVAQTAESLARRSSLALDPAEAFLGGLVHDVGRLAFAIMPVAFLERFYRLTDGGCVLVQAEVCLSGQCHAEVGAATLKEWRFPDTIVEALRWHHRPERSSLPLSSVLYLAEFITGSQEDLPSCVRLNTACRQAGMKAEVLPEMEGERKDHLQSLRFAAQFTGQNQATTDPSS
jgi:putative nucleotidyltransferase with HDIG domain